MNYEKYFLEWLHDNYSEFDIGQMSENDVAELHENFIQMLEDEPWDELDDLYATTDFTRPEFNAWMHAKYSVSQLLQMSSETWEQHYEIFKSEC